MGDSIATVSVFTPDRCLAVHRQPTMFDTMCHVFRTGADVPPVRSIEIRQKRGSPNVWSLLSSIVSATLERFCKQKAGSSLFFLSLLFSFFFPFFLCSRCAEASCLLRWANSFDFHSNARQKLVRLFFDRFENTHIQRRESFVSKGKREKGCSFLIEIKRVRCEFLHG